MNKRTSVNQSAFQRVPLNPFREGTLISDAFALATKGATRKQLQELCAKRGMTFGRILPTLRAGNRGFRGATWITKETKDGTIKIIPPKTAALAPVHFIKLGDRGRMVLPSRIRRQLRLKEGDELVLTVEDDGALRLATLRQQIEKARGMFAGKFPERILSEELIRERRREAIEENKRSGG